MMRHSGHYGTKTGDKLSKVITGKSTILIWSGSQKMAIGTFCGYLPMLTHTSIFLCAASSLEKMGMRNSGSLLTL